LESDYGFVFWKKNQFWFWKLDPVLGNLDYNCQLIANYAAIRTWIVFKKIKNFGFWFQFQT
jgi:hypothetical protein